MNAIIGFIFNAFISHIYRSESRKWVHNQRVLLSEILLIKRSHQVVAVQWIGYF